MRVEHVIDWDSGTTSEIVEEMNKAMARIPPMSRGRIVFRCQVCARVFDGIARDDCDGCVALAKTFRLLTNMGCE